MHPQTPVAECLFERVQSNLGLLLALHGVVEVNTGTEDVELAFVKSAPFGEEGGARVAERVGQEETEYESRGNGECSH